MQNGDLVLMEELLMEKSRKWKKRMETKGLRVNAGEHPCGVCREEVASNSIRCVVS